MLSLETRKKVTKETIRIIENMFLKLTDSKINAALLLISLHYFLVSLTVAHIYFGNKNIYFYISVVIYLLIVILHFYFNGCILTKTERALLNNNEWYGPPSIILYGSENFNKEKINQLIEILAFLIVVNIFLRIIFNISLWLLPIIVVLLFRNVNM